MIKCIIPDEMLMSSGWGGAAVIITAFIVLTHNL